MIEPKIIQKIDIKLVYILKQGTFKRASKEYGKNIIKQYSKNLMLDVGKKYNERTLYGMRKFYEVFSNEKLNPLGSKLSWSHYSELLSIKDENELIYYINIAFDRNLSKR